MPRAMPLFPLSTVLYPGLILPLRIFEERYRTLVLDLADDDDGTGEFGVVAIRHGRETDRLQSEFLYAIGCIARVRQVREVGGGRYHLVSIGTDRFRLLDLADPHPHPYPTATIEQLADPVGSADAALVGRVRYQFERYLELVSGAGADPQVEELPTDPRALSYLVAATMALSLADRQSLLEAPDAATRLRAEHSLLLDEHRLIRTLNAYPATDLARAGFSPN